MTRRRLAAVGALLVALAAVISLWWILRPSPPTLPRAALEPVTFERLPGWGDGAQRGALGAYLRSCARLDRLPPEALLGSLEIQARAQAWRAPCARAAVVADDDPQEARQFFESEFEPFAVIGDGESEGLFTGYYEPELDGSRQRIGRFNVPLYGRPDDLVTVDLSAFRSEWRGMRIAGRLAGGQVTPFDTRTDIAGGTLTGRAAPIMWLRSEVDAFFLHVQGAGRIRLNDGTETRVGFAASNGHPYTSIGRELVARGALSREDVSLQSIRRWLVANPDDAKVVMAANARYIFFRELTAEGPLGAAQVVLTPGRSLAVDTSLVPLHAPLWLVSALPPTEGQPKGSALRRLLISQDTGSAIRGPVRGRRLLGFGQGGGGSCWAYEGERPILPPAPERPEGGSAIRDGC